MGSWAITIHGHGIHDNGRPDDADVLLKQFIDDMKVKGGHVISSVRFTVGADRELTDGEWRHV